MDGPLSRGIIDAHHHLWRYSAPQYPWMSDEMTAIRRDFTAADIAALAATTGVAGTVVVQARQSVAETNWLLEIAEKSPLILGVVGWAPLIDPRLTFWLDQWRDRQQLKGVRHVLHDEADDDYMLRTDFNAGICALAQYDLRYDLLIFERHLPQAITFVDQYPSQIFVLDHIAKPRIRDGVFEPWRGNLRCLAERTNVYCKLSGMVTEALWSDWSPASLKPYFDHVLEVFGPSRMLFGSDWPVLNLASSYQNWIETVRQWIEPLTADEQVAILRETATRAYGLDVPTAAAETL